MQAEALTMHAGKMGLSQDGGYPKLLGIHVCPDQVVARRDLDHGFQLAAHSVSLRETEEELLLSPCLLTRLLLSID